MNRSGSSDRHLRIDRETLDNWQQKKRARMQQIIDYFSEKGEVDKTRFIGQMCLQGFHRQTIIRYLRDLEDAGLIRIDGNRIVWVEDES